jgi:uncharacterized membrane protein
MQIVTADTSRKSRRSNFQWLSDHWFSTFLIAYGTWIFTPFLAPVFMHTGWVGAGRSVYFLYSFFCHQLPERSFFLFGQKSMYSLSEIQAAWQSSVNPFILRQFIGSETMGWKVAWSDRMISFYTSVWFFALFWYPVRTRVKTLPWWAFLLLLAPIAVDGISHALSDLAGIGQGFRDTNAWLVALTNNAFPASFYAGDAIGSFNSWIRFLTGVFAGVGIGWLAFPYICQTQVYNKRLEENSYAKVLNQIQNQNQSPSSRRS